MRDRQFPRHHAIVTPHPHRRPPSGREGPPRLKPFAASLLEDVAAVTGGTPDAELLDLLEAALAQLPSAERAAVMTAYGYGEGSQAVAADLGIAEADAEALTRNALQLLRGALGDAESDETPLYPRLGRSKRSTRPPE
jgi:DNA-directed RNA polymerase specialized sigma24 family protein